MVSDSASGVAVTGDAFVEFGLEDHVRMALERHRTKMGTRYVELFRSSKAEMASTTTRTLRYARECVAMWRRVLCAPLLLSAMTTTGVACVCMRAAATPACPCSSAQALTS